MFEKTAQIRLHPYAFYAIITRQTAHAANARPHGQAVKTSPSHGGIWDSISHEGTKKGSKSCFFSLPHRGTKKGSKSCFFIYLDRGTKKGSRGCFFSLPQQGYQKRQQKLLFLFTSTGVPKKAAKAAFFLYLTRVPKKAAEAAFFFTSTGVPKKAAEAAFFIYLDRGTKKAAEAAFLFTSTGVPKKVAEAAFLFTSIAKSAQAMSAYANAAGGICTKKRRGGIETPRRRAPKTRNSHDAVWCHFINLHVQGGSTAAACFCLPLDEGA